MNQQWVGTWAATPAPADGVSLNACTIRMFPRLSIGGDAIRVRLSNAHGKGDLVVASTHVALRAGGATFKAGTGRQATFAGSKSVKIPAGAFVISDPLEMTVAPLADLAVSLHLPQEVPVAFGVTGRYARQINYLSPIGDFAAQADMHVMRAMDDWYFLAGIDVQAPRNVGGIVAFGDSVTDANISTHDAFARWPDQLARRLVARKGRMFGIMNQGLGGNRILHDGRGDSGVKRFDRDVLAQPGVTHAIILLGINDIRNRGDVAQENVTADEMIGGLAQMALRAKARGIKVFGGTLLPFENEAFMGATYTAEKEGKRGRVNEWIRTGGAFDAVIDFDAQLRDPEHPLRMLPIYDNGDHLHPSDLGYNRMGDIIDLALFD